VLHALPEERRAQCCGSPAGVVLTDECTRVLTQSARSGAVRLDAGAVDACAAALAHELAGCGWVGPFPPALPAACAGVVGGTLGQGARCRSSLECTGSLRCRGAGPTEAGRCSAALPDGELCGLAVDTLAAYVRNDAVERAHPECSGYCERHRCQSGVAVGGSCDLTSQCVAGAHCREGRCAAGAWAAVGEACTGADCAPGSRCFAHRCVVPRAEGQCQSDFECRGGCVGAGDKVCGMRCDVR
jgi:hypothetical protein